MELGFIVHVDDDKSAGGDVITVNTTQQGEIWLVDGYAQPFMSREDAMLSRAGSLSTASVHWCVLLAFWVSGVHGGSSLEEGLYIVRATNRRQASMCVLCWGFEVT